MSAGSKEQVYTVSELNRLARQLLEQSDMDVMAIAVACGFAAPSHFSRAYRRRFGVRPKDERSRKR